MSQDSSIKLVMEWIGPVAVKLSIWKNLCAQQECPEGPDRPINDYATAHLQAKMVTENLKWCGSVQQL